VNVQTLKILAADLIKIKIELQECRLIL